MTKLLPFSFQKVTRKVISNSRNAGKPDTKPRSCKTVQLFSHYSFAKLLNRDSEDHLERLCLDYFYPLLLATVFKKADIFNKYHFRCSLLLKHLLYERSYSIYFKIPLLLAVTAKLRAYKYPQCHWQSKVQCLFDRETGTLRASNNN